jgi:hypothetical protein
MASYVVMQPPAGTTKAEVERTRYIRDGFHVLAFLFPFLWLLWHRLWFEALLAIGVAVALALVGETTGFGVAISLLSLLVAVFVGLEGAAFRVAALRRRGWIEAGVVDAANLDEAETRHIAGGLEPAARGASDYAPVPGLNPARAQVGPALGLLAYPRGR